MRVVISGHKHIRIPDVNVPDVSHVENNARLMFFF